MLDVKYLDKVIVNYNDYYTISIARKSPRTYEYYKKKFYKLEDAVKFLFKHRNYLSRLHCNQDAFCINIRNFHKKDNECELINKCFEGKISNRDTIKFGKYAGESRSIYLARDLSQVYSESFCIEGEYDTIYFGFDYDVLYGDGLKRFNNGDKVKFKEYGIYGEKKDIDIIIHRSSMHYDINGIDKMDEMWDGKTVNCDFTCDANLFPNSKDGGWDYISIPLPVFPCAQFEKIGRVEDDPNHWMNSEGYKKSQKEEG